MSATTAGTTHATAAPEPANKAVQKTRWIILAIIVAFVIAGLFWWVNTLRNVSTNDARVEGHIHPLNARVSGTVIWLNPEVEDTHYVRAGTVLARLDPNDYQPVVDRLEGEVQDRTSMLESAKLDVPITQAQATSRLAGARAAVSEAESELATDMSNVSEAEAHLGSAQAAYRRAEDDRNRYEQLVSSHEISRSEYDQFVTAAVTAQHQVEAAKAALKAAQQKVDGAKEQISQRKADVLAASTAPELITTAKRRVEGVSGQLMQAQAALHSAKLDLSYTEIVAPVSGVISRKSIESGQRVQTGDLLMTIVPLNDVWIVADYKETQLSSVRPGQAVTIHVDTYGRDYSGHVDSIGGNTGSVSSPLPPENATGNFVKVIQRVPVRIRLDHVPDQQQPLLPGMSAEPTVHVK